MAFLGGMVQFINHRLEARNLQNTFVYLISHKGSASFTTTEEFVGTTHADDLIYLFPLNKNGFINSIPTSEDEELFEYMPMFWTNFAKYG